MIKYLLVILLYTINCSTIDVSAKPDKSDLKKVKALAIIPFDFKGKSNIAEEFATSISIYLVKTGRVDVIERNKLEIEKILQEQKLSRSGLLDESTATKMGKMMGVDSILIGYGDTKEISGKTIINSFRLKLLNVESGSIILGVVKDPGIEWTFPMVAKYILGLTLIWDKNDLLIESSSPKFLSTETSKAITNGLQVDN